jgi:hypothetical protein
MTATKTAGLLVHADDLAVGKHYAVHGLRNDPGETHPIFGQAFKLKAMNLHFLVGKFVGDPSHPPVTFDVRFLTIMRVTPEYVKAQKPPDVPDAD